MSSYEEKLFKYIETLKKQLDKQIVAGNFYILTCTNCGTTFKVDQRQSQLICFECGEILDANIILRDNRTQKLEGDYNSYNDLIAAARQHFNEKNWSIAAQAYCCALAVDDTSGQAWEGLLRSLTENFTKMEENHPNLIYEKAQNLTSSDNTALYSDWIDYKETCKKYFEKEYELIGNNAMIISRNRHAKLEAAGNVIKSIFSGIGDFFVYHGNIVVGIGGVITFIFGVGSCWHGCSQLLSGGNMAGIGIGILLCIGGIIGCIVSASSM